MRFEKFTLIQKALQALVLHTYFTSAAFTPIGLQDNSNIKTDHINSQSQTGVLKGTNRRPNQNTNANSGDKHFEGAIKTSQFEAALQKRQYTNTSTDLAGDEFIAYEKYLGVEVGLPDFLDEGFATTVCLISAPICVMYVLALCMWVMIVFFLIARDYNNRNEPNEEISKNNGLIFIASEDLYKMGQEYVPSERATYSKDLGYTSGEYFDGLDCSLSLAENVEEINNNLKKTYSANKEEYTKLLKHQRGKMEEKALRNGGLHKRDEITDEMVHKELAKGIESDIKFGNVDLLCTSANKQKCSKTFLNYNVANFVKEGENLIVFDPLPGGDYKDLYISIILGLNGGSSKKRTLFNDGLRKGIKMIRQHAAVFLNLGNVREIAVDDEMDFSNIGGALGKLIYNKISGDKYTYCGKGSGDENDEPKKVTNLSDLVNSIRYTVSFGTPGPAPVECGEAKQF